MELTPAEKHFLMNGSVFDPVTGSFRQPVDILIEGARIRQVGMLNERNRTQATLIDCTDKYLLPGLFESHAHLSSLVLLDTHTKERWPNNTRRMLRRIRIPNDR